MPSNNTENILSTPFTEGTANPIPASRISYDGTTSGLSATNAQAAIDEVASIAASKMQYIAVPQAISIFDLIQNAEGSRIYASYAPRFTNGTDDLTTLLGVSQYARVEIFCYSKYLAVIRVVNPDGVFAIAYLDAGSTSINFMKVTTTGNSVVTVTQST